MIDTSTSRLRQISAAALLAAGFTSIALGASVGSLGAQATCGQGSVSFEGTRLLNDGVNNTAGPFSVNIPAGTYDIVMHSHDAHDEHPGQFDQTAEQWYFTLDSGYVSPPTIDIADDANTSVTEANGQVIGASTSITVHHRGEGNVNSVDPICVGFTPVDVVVAAPETTVAPAPETTVAPSREVAGPTTTVVAATPTTQVQVPTTQVEAVVPEVKAVVEVQAPAAAQELAVTGSNVTSGFIAGGITLLMGGIALVVAERRRLFG